MKFRIIEDFEDDVDYLENSSKLSIEFHIYDSNSDNNILTQLEQRISAFGADSKREADMNNDEYTLLRLKKVFNNVGEIVNFFQVQFKDFIGLLNTIWKSGNFVLRVVVIDTQNPPNRIPGRSYVLVNNNDYNNMILSLKNK